ncbi:MAG TPA: DUF3108 domain-containing protein [Pyrinomonadaceae bacterium]|nr:DUF3108 domain-containing protein [Pyrinomonadaceae bacterium]
MGRQKGTLTGIAAALAALLCLSTAARAQAPFSAAPYRTGERLTYTVAFSNFPTAAHVELEVAGRGEFYGREGVELRAHVETIGVVSAALYAINNNYTSFVDPLTGTPYRAQQIIREGARAEDLTREFDAATAAAPSSNSQKQPTLGVPGTFDLLSALYRLRALPLAPGAAYRLTVQNGATAYDTEIKVTGRELIKTNVGSSNALVTQVRVRGDASADDYRVRVYFTDDERRVPVLITARHRAGEIRAELASAEYLPDPTGAAPGPNAVPPTPQPTPPPAGVRPTPTPRPGTRPAGSGAIPTINAPFKPGEQLNFNFFLGAAPPPVGTATFQVRAKSKYFNREGLLLTAVIQTTGAGQTLFPVDDRLSSYVDVKTLLPFRTELGLNEGKRKARWVVSSDQTSGNALFDDGTRIDIPVNTHDLLSVFYALRTFDLSPGKRNAVPLLVNKRPRPLYVTALRNDAVTLGTQRIPAVELALTTGDPQGDRFSLRLWVSTDGRRLPLRLTAQTPLGPVRADLAIIPTTLQ